MPPYWDLKVFQEKFPTLEHYHLLYPCRLAFTPRIPWENYALLNLCGTIGIGIKAVPFTVYMLFSLQSRQEWVTVKISMFFFFSVIFLFIFVRFSETFLMILWMRPPQFLHVPHQDSQKNIVTEGLWLYTTPVLSQIMVS